MSTPLTTLAHLEFLVENRVARAHLGAVAIDKKGNRTFRADSIGIDF
jgi:hypothetical protein